VVIGAHIAARRPVTVEVVERRAGDVGGAMARVDGLPQIVESFRLPPGSPLNDSAIFNTNTFVFDMAALSAPQPLSFFPVRKSVDGVGVIQFERLLGQITAFLPTQILHVPRDGADNRFIPIKLPGDLQTSQPDIAAVLKARRTLEKGL
jgi:UTP--glucose-1-phosphate uridylyltransferase